MHKSLTHNNGVECTAFPPLSESISQEVGSEEGNSSLINCTSDCHAEGIDERKEVKNGTDVLDGLRRLLDSSE